MIILTLKTDQPNSEFALYDDRNKLADINYLADRDLASTIHQQIKTLLEGQQLDWQDIKAVACYEGPGSFTGLRIGLSVANALAYGLNIPIIGEQGKDWQSKAIAGLLKGGNQKLVIPFYGAEPHITKPRK